MRSKKMKENDKLQVFLKLRAQIKLREANRRTVRERERAESRG